MKALRGTVKLALSSSARGWHNRTSNGRELFYRRGAELMTVPVETESSFTPGTPEVLFEGLYQLGLGRASPPHRRRTLG